MIVTHFEQGSPEWHQSRCGIPTASRFKDVMAISEARWRVVRDSGTLVKSFTSEAAAKKCAADKFKIEHVPPTPLDAHKEYVLDIACQRMTEAFCDSEGWSNFWTDRGHELEPLARKYYQFLNGVKVETCGLILTDERDAGASADGLVGDDGGTEIKCYKRTKHMQIVLQDEVPKEDMPQVQGCMFITGRPWWDYIAFHPDAPIDGHIIRVERDEAYMKQLADGLALFNRSVEKMISHMQELVEAKIAA